MEQHYNVIKTFYSTIEEHYNAIKTLYSQHY